MFAFGTGGHKRRATEGVYNFTEEYLSLLLIGIHTLKDVWQLIIIFIILSQYF